MFQNRADFRRRSAALAGAAALAVSMLAPSAGAQSLRFTTNAPGGIAATGNTLGLSKALNANGPGTEDSIGTFVSLGNTTDNVPANAGNPWPMGTTNDWTQNGSTAHLTLPSESSVLYAELLWGGSYNYGGQNVAAQLDTPVAISMGASSLMVVPSATTALTVAETAATGFAVNYYMRSADVTAFVQAAGGGDYSVEGVPATEATSINSLNAAGWTLVVAYRDESAPIRNLSVFVGGSFVDEDATQDYTVSGFCSPPLGDVEGTVAISTIEGDADLVGDQLLIGPSAAGPFVNLQGPNNPANNFFCSQMNDAAGQLDTAGTFGMANHDAIAGVNVSGARQGWDVTTVSLSSQDGQLDNDQTSAVLRTITTGDSYMPILAAFALDVNAPDFPAGSSSIVGDPDPVAVGDKLTVTAKLGNAGEGTATGVTLTVPAATGLSLASFQLDGMPGDINGNPVDAAALAAGIDAGTLPKAKSREAVLVYDVTGAPQNGAYFVTATWSYGFNVCLGGPPESESFKQVAIVGFDDAAAAASSTTSGSGATSTGSGSGGGDGLGGFAGAPSTGTQASGGNSATGNAGEVVESDSGCSCSLPASGDSGSWRTWGALLAVATLGVRRRRTKSPV